ncbi:MAG: prephenate dehydrogenase/arogenate dehydrogenase family protein [Pirellulaceae bacterium]|nr:prephenate dehydrogenase/arogenate dehydrogenase family protein [Pirellulaceae bacterium]
MTQYNRAVIIGVGLLGGSIGLALRRRQLARTVVGLGHRPQTLQTALELGAIDCVCSDIQTACKAADLIIVCTPVQAIVNYVQQALKCELSDNCLITDVGSTKANICKSLRSASARFCGSHPIAGSEKSGVRFAREDLLVDRLTIVTPDSNTPPELARQSELLWQSLGSRTVVMSPDQHDQALAHVSHLPHIVASALAAITDQQLLPLVGSGWCDTTRVAAGNVELWQQIISENRQPVQQAMRVYARSLEQWIGAIERGDTEQLVELLQAGKTRRDSVVGSRETSGD